MNTEKKRHSVDPGYYQDLSESFPTLVRPPHTLRKFKEIHILVLKFSCHAHRQTNKYCLKHNILATGKNKNSVNLKYVFLKCVLRNDILN